MSAVLFFSRDDSNDDEEEVLWVYDPKAVPEGKSHKTWKDYHMLPQTCKECRAVDHKRGRWYHCDVCDREIAVREDGRDFTLGRWNEHVKKDTEHLKIVARKKEVRRLKLKRKKGPLSKFDSYELNRLDKKQTPMSQWFSFKKKPKNDATSNTAGNATAAASTPAGADAPSVVNLVNDDKVSQPSAKKPATCEGVLPDYTTALQTNINAYMIYCAVRPGTDYKFATYGARRLAQVFSVECNGTGGVSRKVQTHGNFFCCPKCDELR